jgi:hypothetical protein
MHRGSGIFAPVLTRVPGQTICFAPVLFEVKIEHIDTIDKVINFDKK